MTSEETTATTTAGTEESEALPCFVRHHDAGGQCDRIATMEVYGLDFCEAHGEEARLGAGLERYDDAEYFFERFRNPHVLQQSDGVERTLEFALKHLREESPSGSDHLRALEQAYPEIPEDTRGRLVRWQLDEKPGYAGVLDILLSELHTLYKLLRITDAQGMTWLVEELEEERQSLAAQAAHLLRNPQPPEAAEKRAERPIGGVIEPESCVRD